MPYTADCTDCGWTFEDQRREPVVDALERHARKEQHHVDFLRQPIDAAV